MRTAFIVAVTLVHNMRIVDVKALSKHDEAVREWVLEGGDDELEDVFYCHGHDGFEAPSEPGVYLLTAHVALGDEEAELMRPRWSSWKEESDSE